MRTLIRLLFLLTFATLTGAEVTVPGSLTHENTLTPGQVIEGSIPIQNNGDEAATVKVSLTDYLYNASGETLFPDPGTNDRSNADWIEFSQKQLTVAPHTTYHMPYKLTVPKKESLEGSYWSILLVEPISDPSAAIDEKQALGVQTIIRYGIQVISHIQNTGAYDLKISEKKIAQEEQKRIFSLSVENLGSLMQSPLLSLELIDSSGKSAGKFTTSKQRLLPSCSTTYQLDLSSVPPGDYKAMAFLDHGDDALFGAKYDMKIE